MTKSKQPMSGAKAKSGGGANMNKVRSVGVKGGSPNLKSIPPTHASHIGRSVGNHSMDKGTVKRPPTPGPTAKRDFVSMGNAVALNGAGAGARPGGAGRVIHPTSSQGMHGAPRQPEGPVMPAQGSG